MSIINGVHPNTPPPSGNTQDQNMLFGSRYMKAGQPVTKPIAQAPGGALKITMTAQGYTGGVQVPPPTSGLQFVFSEGRLIFAGATVSSGGEPPPPPIPLPPRPR